MRTSRPLANPRRREWFKTPATVWSVDSSTDELDSAVVTLKADSGLLLATAGAVEIRLALVPTVNG